MSRNPSDRPFRLRDRRRKIRKVFDFADAQAMLPLVRSIVTDLVTCKARVSHLACVEKRTGRTPASGARLSNGTTGAIEELRVVRNHADELIAELEHLGLVMLDPVRGTVGFPTIVNESLAYLVLIHEDIGIRYWRYRDQPKLRPTPAHWAVQTRSADRPNGMVI